jgi:hypothetical protein
MHPKSYSCSLPKYSNLGFTGSGDNEKFFRGIAKVVSTATIYCGYRKNSTQKLALHGKRTLPHSSTIPGLAHFMQDLEEEEVW